MNLHQKILITNRSEEKLRLILEPWAEEYWVPPKAFVEVIGHSQAEGCFEIEHSSNHLIIYGWNGSIVNVLSGGKKLIPFQKT